MALSKITTSSYLVFLKYLLNLYLNRWINFWKNFGDLAGTILLIKTLKDGGLNFRDLVKDDIFINMKRYSDFPKYQMPSNFINSISQNTPHLCYLFYFLRQYWFFSLHIGDVTPIFDIWSN